MPTLRGALESFCQTGTAVNGGQLVDEMVGKELKIGNTFLCGNTCTILACVGLLKGLNRATAFHIKRLMK